MDERVCYEKDKYNKIYTDLVFASDDLRQILDDKEINKRSFITKVDTLKDYMNFLDEIEKESKENRGFFKKLFKPSKNINDQINNYLTQEKRINLEKLEKCSKCKCRNCASICPMNHCFNCMDKEYVNNCNKKDSLFTNIKDTLTLYQGDEKIIFNVVGYLVEKDEEGNYNRYIYLIDSKNQDNQHILKYSKFKGEHYYDSLIVDNTQDELIRINNKFIEMGLRV